MKLKTVSAVALILFGMFFIGTVLGGIYFPTKQDSQNTAVVGTSQAFVRKETGSNTSITTKTIDYTQSTPKQSTSEQVNNVVNSSTSVADVQVTPSTPQISVPEPTVVVPAPTRTRTRTRAS